MQDGKYRIRALEMAKDQGLLPTVFDKKNKRRQEKEEMKTREDLAIRKILEENMDIK